MHPGGNKNFLFLAIFAITAGEFLFDLATPHGVADWVLYFIPLMLSSLVGGRNLPYLLAAALTVLSPAGYYFSPPDVDSQLTLFGRLLGLVAFWVVAILIAQHKKTEESLRRTERALRTISSCNQALVRATDEPTLLREVCNVIVEKGGYRMAWVGFAENDEYKSVRIAASAGCDEGYLAQAKISWSDATERGRGPVGNAIRTGKIIACNDFQNDPTVAPWHAEAAQRGYAALIVLPLHSTEKTFGVLALYGSETNTFNAAEVELLTELTDDLAFGIHTLRARAEHEQAEAQLHKLSFAVEHSPASIVITNLKGDIEYVNPKFTEVTGYTLAEARGQNPRVLKSGQMPPEFYRQLWQTISAGHEWRGEIHNRKKNGELYWETASISPLTDGEGTITGYVAVKDDISRDKLAEEKIREQSQMLNLAHDAITIRDLDNRITYWNHGAERIYGWSQAEAIGQIADELLKFDSFKMVEALRLILEKGYWNGEFIARAKNGHELLIESTWTLVRDEAGHPKSIFATSSDITAARKLEQQVARSQRIESLGTLASGVAHDLNNILTPIMISISLLKEQVTEPTLLHLLGSLDASTHRGAQLVKQILTFGRGVQGERSPLSLRELAREIQRLLQETFPKSIQLEIIAPDDLWLVVGDHTQLHQVFLNLAINARDAMPNGGKLTFTFQNHTVDPVYAGLNPEARPGANVLIQVTDTGTGIRKEIIDRIFDPFFTTKAHGQGTGLGLSTTLGIVKSHGGFINVYSEPGKGTTFKIYLPANANAEQSEQQAVTQNGLPRGHDELVLFVDDEEAITTTIKKILERHGYRALTAANGAEAVSLYAAHAHKIAVVITDMHMPIMDGPATIVALKSMNPHIKIIGSSGLAANGGVAKAANSGVRHFVPKPYTAEKMLRTIRDILDGGDDGEPSV